MTDDLIRRTRDTRIYIWVSQMALAEKNLPASAGDWGSLGWEDPPEKEMSTHSSILAWRISWMEKPGGLQSMGSKRVGLNLGTKQ